MKLVASKLILLSVVFAEIITGLVITRSVYAAPDKSTSDGSILSTGVVKAIRSYIENNPTSIVAQIDPRIAIARAKMEEGFLDPVIGAEFGTNRQTIPSSSVLGGSRYTESSRDFKLYSDKKFSTGTLVSLHYRGGRFANTSPITTLRPEYQSEFGLGIAQPLLKGAFSGSPYWEIEWRKLQSEASYWQAVENISQNVSGVIQTYWNLYLSEQALLVAKKNVELAKWLSSEAQERVAVGLQSELAKLDADAELASREQSLILAINNREIARRSLLELLGEDTAILEDKDVKLEDTPILRRIDIKESEYLDSGKINRALLKARRADLRAAEIQEKIADNKLLPTLDLKLDGAVRGISGEGVPGQSEIPPFIGGYEDSLSDASSGDYYRYGIGIKMERSLSNEVARQESVIAQLSRTKGSSYLRAAENLVAIEQRNALSSIKAASQRVQASDKAILAAKEALRMAEKRFSLGLTTSREVLDLQRSLISAELASYQARTDFEIAVVDLYQGSGDVLQRYGIDVNLNMQ